MKFRAGQELIDILRGKKKLKLNPRSVVTVEFWSKICALLKICAKFHYPETKTDYTPDFTKPILLEKNPMRAWCDYRCALERLQQLDIDKLAETYNALADEYSKEIMLKSLAYNCFDEPRLRFPVFYSPYLQMAALVDSCITDEEEICLWDGALKLKKHTLSKLGYDITLWQNTIGTIIDFVEEQYRYRDMVMAVPGDVVIDAGACYGDTALYFSEKTKGMDVYSFEFLPENVEIFKKNIELNPQYARNIHLVQSPVGDVSGDKLYAVPNGPGTSITNVKQDNAIELEIVSIDDFVERNHIEKVDFIKMDIEGSEAAALRGASKTIRKYRPKLAICVYHKPDDLCVIPQLIKSMVPEYKLYLDHFTMNSTETVLFAGV